MNRLSLILLTGLALSTTALYSSATPQETENTKNLLQALDSIVNFGLHNEEPIEEFKRQLDLPQDKQLLKEEEFLFKLARKIDAGYLGEMAFKKLPFLATPEFLEARDHFGNTPLYYAIEHPAGLVPILLRHHANVNTRNSWQRSDGNTPLHRALEMNESDIVRKLMANKANPFIQNKEGLTAFDYARKMVSNPRQYKRNHIGAASLLLKYEESFKELPPWPVNN